MIKHEKIHIIIVGISSQTAPVTMQKTKNIWAKLNNFKTAEATVLFLLQFRTP